MKSEKESEKGWIGGVFNPSRCVAPATHRGGIYVSAVTHMVRYPLFTKLGGHGQYIGRYVYFQPGSNLYSVNLNANIDTLRVHLEGYMAKRRQAQLYTHLW